MSKKEPYIPIKKNALPVLDEQDRQKKFEFTHQEVCCMIAHLGVGEELQDMINPDGETIDSERLKRDHKLY